MRQIESIYDLRQSAFKINISLGLILQNVETGVFRFFVPYHNESIFLFPQLISNRNDIDKIRKKLAALDILNYFQKQRPSTKWKPVMITNVLYQVYKTGFPLGLGQPLPAYITNSKSILAFENDRDTS